MNLGGGEIDRMYGNITVSNHQVEIINDALLNGWGAVMGTNSTGGVSQMKKHKNT